LIRTLSGPVFDFNDDLLVLLCVTWFYKRLLDVLGLWFGDSWFGVFGTAVAAPVRITLSTVVRARTAFYFSTRSRFT
jgi:hypothetical protein